MKRNTGNIFSMSMESIWHLKERERKERRKEGRKEGRKESRL
jgi:hypothetical protein